MLALQNTTHHTRRYFRKFTRITGHLARVAGVMEAEGRLSKREARVVARYLLSLGTSFHALSLKYHFSGRTRQAGSLDFDRRESGFPVATELMEMANDAAQAPQHLAELGSVQRLKQEMVSQIVGQLKPPTALQFALSQRLYYEELQKGGLFWARNDPQIEWIENIGDRRRFLVSWAVYDTQINMPTIYAMYLEDSGRTPLPKDDRRWPAVQAHLMAQAIGGLKLLTIAKGFDEDFDDLHPKRLRRLHVGPMYSAAFTEQTGPLQQVLETAASPEGEDWALVWTMEELESDAVERVKSGWFSKVDREIFALDPFAGQGGETGATRTERSIILPQRPYQSLEELNPPGFRDVRKFVVNPAGRVLSYR